MGLIVVIVDLSIYRRWEYLITEELNFVGKRAKEEGNIVPVACCGLPPRWCDFIGARITSADHI